MKPSPITLPIMVSFVVLFTSQLCAQEKQLPCDEIDKKMREATPLNKVQKISTFEPAEVIERVDPRYPVTAARAGAEGWVQMSYVIDVDGKVKDPVVEDYGGYSGFKRAALIAIQDWTYAPAMKNGKPTEQCHKLVQFDFTMEGNTGATRRFVRVYKEANEKIASEDYAAAEALVQEMHSNNKKHNRYENAWLWRVDSVLAKRLGDTKRELHSLRRTLASSVSHFKDRRTFDDAYIGYMRQRLFSLEVYSAHYASAMKTIEKIESMSEAESLLKPLQSTIDKVHDLIASEENISVKVGLNEDESYFHLLARHNFAFANINGQLDTVEVRCDSKREKYTVAEAHIWFIPESWGQCQVMVKGKKDTTFDLIEVGKV